MPDLIQSVTWPGVAGVEFCEGTISHGISPGLFVLGTFPQVAKPTLYGSLTIGDGQRSVILRRCKVDRITGSTGPDGQTWTLEILDRRWRWRNQTASLGAIHGRYNRMDSRGKLVPWSIRSPHELATLCLQALGERNFYIDLPQGLPAAAGKDLERYLVAGENFAQSLANPEQFWDATPPAEALARLCDYFGRRICYQITKDRFVIVPLGVGKPLPDGPYEVRTPSVDVPELPSGVTVAGAPIRFNVRFLLEPVGLEFDGHYRPINELSYAPLGGGKKQVSTCHYFGPDPAVSTAVLDLTFTWTDSKGGEHEVNILSAANMTTIADRWAETLALIAANEELSSILTASVSGTDLTFTGKQEGQAFSVTIRESPGEDPAYTLATTQEAQPAGPTWRYCPPPSFSAVRPTERLSHTEAVELAQRSVWRCYRIVNADPASGKPPLRIPGGGNLNPGPRLPTEDVPSAITIKRRQQIILQPTQVRQVEPQAREGGGLNAGRPVVPEQGILPIDFYNGYSRDKSPIIYGNVSSAVGDVIWKPEAIQFPNTGERRLYLHPQIDPIEQIVIFDDFVYKQGGVSAYLTYEKPRLILETGCLVEDLTTGVPVRYTRSLPLGGDAPAEWLIRDDLQVGVIGVYNDVGEPEVYHKLKGYQFLDQADTDKRAAYYLAGMAAKYQLPAAESRQYVGIYAIDLDGAVQQVTWRVGPGGPTTIASINSEHSPAIPSYPTRRKAELLPPNQAAALANLSDKIPLQNILPKAQSDPRK